MSFEPTLNDVFDTLVAMRKELNDLRETLEKKGAPRAYSASASSPSQDAGVPQPTVLVPDPGAVKVHFGKNAGKPIADLSERSLGWYAQDPEPRVDKDGNPFPPRAEDVALRQACRQLWHARKGTLAGMPEMKPSAPAVWTAVFPAATEAVAKNATTEDPDSIPF